MQKVICVNKPIGVTPLGAIKKICKLYPNLANKKIAYAGRLDPMASGLLLLLVHPETKNRTKYQNLDKNYQFEIMFGVSTDTYDLLGKLTSIDPDVPSFERIKKDLERVVSNLAGVQYQKYPSYSSIRVDGKPLYWHARNNNLENVPVPQKKVTIYQIKIISLHKVDTVKVRNTIIKRIRKVQGDFRQATITKKWEKYFQNLKNDEVFIARLTAKVSSGTYIRSIVNDIGINLNIPTTTYSIKRTSVGKYKLGNAIDIK